MLRNCLIRNFEPKESQETFSTESQPNFSVKEWIGMVFFFSYWEQFPFTLLLLFLSILNQIEYDSLSFRENSEKGKDTDCLTDQNWTCSADLAWHIFIGTCRFLLLYFLLGAWFLCHLGFLNSKMLKFPKLPKNIIWRSVKYLGKIISLRTEPQKLEENNGWNYTQVHFFVCGEWG